MAQTFYVGTYWSPNTGRQELDVNSFSNKYDRTVKQFYQDMNDEHVTDGSYDDAEVYEQMDALADSDCDIVHIEADELTQLQQKLNDANNEGN